MHTRGHRAAVESLESRRLMSVGVVAKKMTLQIVGTEGADNIRVTAHPSLINFVDVIVRNAAGREQTFVATGRFTTIRVDAGGGNDEIMIDASLRGLAPDVGVWLDGGSGNDRVTACSLPGTIALRDGNDLGKIASDESITIYGDGGNDRVEVAGRAMTADGGTGDDTLVAGDGKHALRGGDGDDHLRATSRGAKLSGGAGDDEIVLVATSARTGSLGASKVHGDAGADTIRGSSDRDYLRGDDGDDVLISGGGRGDALYGDAGDDVLDARGSDAATIDGGDGNDDLYAGDDTDGIGGSGDDWFARADWASTDQTEREATLVVTPNTGSYGSVSGLFISNGTVDFAGGGTADVTRTVYVQRLDDVGFVASADDVEIPPGSRPILSIAAGESGRLSPTLTKVERKAARVGVVRLPAGWKAEPATAIHGGDFVWYDVRFGRGGDHAKTAEFGTVFQLCVKAGTVIVSADGAFTSKAGRIGRARADTLAMSIVPGSVARVAGAATTYRVSGDVLDAADVDAPAGRRGILVDGGAIWLASGDAATTFISDAD